MKIRGVNLRFKGKIRCGVQGLIPSITYGLGLILKSPRLNNRGNLMS